MSMRFRKSVKICKGVKVNFSKSGASLSLGGAGHSLNIGKNGTKATVGIPGSGLSYSTNLTSNAHNNSVYSNNSRTTSSQSGSISTIRMNDKRQITFWDSNGTQVTDEEIIRCFKKTDVFKTKKADLEIRMTERVEEKIKQSAEENEKFLNIHTLTPVVDSEEIFENQYKSLEPERFVISAPTKEEIEAKLIAEAQTTVKAPFWKRSKVQRQFVLDNLEQRYSMEFDKWSETKSAYERMFLDEYEADKAYMKKVIEGDSETICEILDQWISSCELPVEIDISYELDVENRTLLLDVDLPEIEDLPEKIMTKTSKGSLKEKKKTQGEMREEYATCVFGLAVFITANAFNIAPTIKKILISGYTQRRDKDGNLNDDYIYSIKFPRDIFEGKDVSRVNPQDVCMSVPNRCNMTATSLFKTIKPFDTYDD